MNKIFSIQIFMSGIVVLNIINCLGCATVDELASIVEPSKKIQPLTQISSAARYSDNQNLGVPTDRQYKRMTRNRLEEESDLGSTAGSSWVMDGQGAYLFTQNKTRKEGDLLNVKLDASAMNQVETKVGVIKKLLKQLDDPTGLGGDLAKNDGAARTPASEEKKPEATATESKEEKNELKDIQSIPTRIVERLPDGNYRVKGQYPFMIGKRDYKVIVTGMIRPEDFSEQMISSDKLLDPQYDVVNIRKAARNE